MKKTFLIVFVLIGLGAKAQYFQMLYGSLKNRELLSDGHNVYNGGTGHFLVGPSEFTPLNGSFNSINIQKADLNGTTTTPGNFNNHYEVTDIAGMWAASNPNLVTTEVHSLELSNGTGYAIAGAYSGGLVNAGYGIYMQFIDNIGQPPPGLSNAFGYYPSGSYIAARVKSFIESKKNPGIFYICGFLVEAVTRYNRIFVIKVDNTGTIIWDHIYDLNYNTPDSDIPYDMVEAPVQHPTHSLDEFWIVGEHRDFSTATPTTDAFILRIDDIWGNTLNPNVFYGTPGSRDVFTSIIPTANNTVDPSGNGAGFVIGGYTDENGHYDAWSIAMDNTHTVAWSHKYNYMINGMPTNNNDFCNHIMERINTTGQYEYYFAGSTDQGVMGTLDALVFKTNNTGNLVPAGQFTYGDVDYDEAIRIDQLNNFGTNTDGIALYCQSFHIPQIGGFDHYLVKTYFNGVTTCKEDQQDGEEHPGPGWLNDVNSDNTGPNNFNTQEMLINIYANLSELQICYAPDLTDGDNARMAPVKPEENGEGTLSPNPVAQGVKHVTVEIETKEAVGAQVAIYDMLGRACYTNTVQLAKGKNNLMLDMSSANMAAGMYSVKITGHNLNENIMLLVK